MSSNAVDENYIVRVNFELWLAYKMMWMATKFIIDYLLLRIEFCLASFVFFAPVLSIPGDAASNLPRPAKHSSPLGVALSSPFFQSIQH